jgi:hypothetical protein
MISPASAGARTMGRHVAISLAGGIQPELRLFSCSVVSAENGYTMKVKDAASRSPADTLQPRTLAISDDENDGGSCT